MRFMLVLRLTLSFMALILGAIGLFVPVLPTTPFVLLAVGGLSTTPAIQKRVLSIPFVLKYYESYTKKKGLDQKTVIVSLVFLWGMLLLSAIMIQALWIRILLMIVGISVTTHILFLAKEKK